MSGVWIVQSEFPFSSKQGSATCVIPQITAEMWGTTVPYLSIADDRRNGEQFRAQFFGGVTMLRRIWNGRCRRPYNDRFDLCTESAKSSTKTALICSNSNDDRSGVCNLVFAGGGIIHPLSIAHTKPIDSPNIKRNMRSFSLPLYNFLLWGLRLGYRRMRSVDLHFSAVRYVLTFIYLIIEYY